MAQKKFLVTGATGATGGYTVERLLERGHAVRALAHRESLTLLHFIKTSGASRIESRAGHCLLRSASCGSCRTALYRDSD